MTRMESPPRGAAAWSVLFATASILAFAVPAHAQVTLWSSTSTTRITG